MSDSIQYDLILNAKLDSITNDLTKLQSKLDTSSKNMGDSAGSKFGSAFGSQFQSIVTGYITGSAIIGAFNSLTSSVGNFLSNSISSYTNLKKANVGLDNSLEGLNRTITANNSVLKSGNSTLEQKALALGYTTDKIYENVSASKAASGQTKSLEDQIKKTQRAFDDQSASIEKNIKTLQTKADKDTEAIRNAQGYNNLTASQKQREKEINDLTIQKLEAQKNGDALTAFTLENQIKKKELDKSLDDAKIKQIDLQTEKVQNLADVQIKQLRAELDKSKNQLEIDITPAKRALEDLRQEVSGGGSIQRIKPEIAKAIAEATATGLKTVNPEDARKMVLKIYDDPRYAGIISKGTLNKALSNILQGGNADLETAEKLIRRYIDAASQGKSENIDLATAIENLSEAYKTGSSQLGNISGISENFNRIDQVGLSILQAKGELQGKNLDALSKEELAMARASGTLQLTTDRQYGFSKALGYTVDEQGRLGEKTGENLLAQDELDGQWRRLSQTTGTLLYPAFQAMTESMGNLVKNVTGYIKQHPEFQEQITIIAKKFIELAEKGIIKAGEWLGKFIDYADSYFKKNPDWEKKLQKQIDGFLLLASAIGSVVDFLIKAIEFVGKFGDAWALSAKVLTTGIGGDIGNAIGSFIGQAISGKHARGADFIVPNGYENDKYPLLVQSGERVQITPDNQVNNNNTNNYYNFSSSSNAGLVTTLQYG